MKKIGQRLLLLSLLGFPALAKAQVSSPDDWGVNDFNNGGVYLGTKNIESTIAGVVNIVLGFLGIIATLGIIIGGITMMTSGGNADKSSKGQNAAVAGAIGLIIVLTAYAISRYLLDKAYEATVL